MFKVKSAKTEEEITRILQLRYVILRKPWNQPIDTATDSIELNCVNAYIENEAKEIIACGRLQENENKIGQIRFMAVSQDYQGKGLGKLILDFLEGESKKMNLDCIELQARENAVDFYKKCDYHIKEKSFLLWGIIQHFLMEKKIQVDS